MRFRLVAGLAGTTVVAAAVLAAGAVGSTPSDRAALPLPTGYQAKALVQINLRTAWNRWHPKKEGCGVWFLSEGKNRVFAEGLVAGFIGFTPRGAGHWSEIGLFGDSIDEDKTSSRRWLKEQSGVNWGLSCSPPAPKPKPYKIPDNDCEPWGSKKERQVRVAPRHFVVSADRRKSDVTLADLLDPGGEGRHRALTVSAVPRPNGWYKNCSMQLGPADPVNLAALVTEDDVNKLRALKPGKNYTFEYDTRESGPTRQCDDPNVLGPDAKCVGWYEISIIFHRVKPGETWPRP